MNPSLSNEEKPLDAAARLGVPPDTIEPFEADDTFNAPNKLRGFLCRQSTRLYGALLITHIDDRELGHPQLVYGTPKQHYPFATSQETGVRKYRWPRFKRVRVYEKWDGTNIFAYSYRDADGRAFITYKTRLTPVVRDGKFGGFATMWRRLLDTADGLNDLIVRWVGDGSWGMSFEMCGYENPVLVQYDFPLAVKLIFGVHQEQGAISPPEMFQSSYSTPCLTDVGSDSDVSKLYEVTREQAHQSIRKNDDGTLAGTEGAVFYVFSDEGWSQWKCKPEDVEKIHWSGDFIDYNSIYVTAKNALENVAVDSLTPEFVNTLLKEEYSDKQIANSTENIAKAIAAVREHCDFLDAVRQQYVSCPCEARGAGKAGVMRFMSGAFKRSQMRLVYSALRELGLLTDPRPDA